MSLLAHDVVVRPAAGALRLADKHVRRQPVTQALLFLCDSASKGLGGLVSDRGLHPRQESDHASCCCAEQLDDMPCLGDHLCDPA